MSGALAKLEAEIEHLKAYIHDLEAAISKAREEVPQAQAQSKRPGRLPKAGSTRRSLRARGRTRAHQAQARASARIEEPAQVGDGGRALTSAPTFQRDQQGQQVLV